MKYKKDGKDGYEVYKTYLNGQSSFYEVNITKAQYAPIHQKISIYMRSRREGIDGVLEQNIFDDVLTTIISNLADTMSRFMLTSEYKQYIQNRRMKVELLDKI